MSGDRLSAGRKDLRGAPLEDFQESAGAVGSCASLVLMVRLRCIGPFIVKCALKLLCQNGLPLQAHRSRYSAGLRREDIKFSNLPSGGLALSTIPLSLTPSPILGRSG